MFKRILKHIEARRNWNRTKRFLCSRAVSRYLITVGLQRRHV